jgi:2-iminobutanoate/2-iminopropanoate deaminase
LKKIINSLEAPAPVGPYNHSVKVGNTLYVSGQIAIDQSTGSLVIDTIEAETHQVLKNMGYILKAAGMDFNDVVKCSVFVADMEQYSSINAVYATYFDEASAPARELVQVANLPKYVNVEISCIAHKISAYSGPGLFTPIPEKR